jgi:hypothetical protein
MNLEIPNDATHVWTPAVFRPYAGFGIYRRAFYKKDDEGNWLSYSYVSEWVRSTNDSKWFDKMQANGEFVTIEVFIDPDFVPVED